MTDIRKFRDCLFLLPLFSSPFTLLFQRGKRRKRGPAEDWTDRKEGERKEGRKEN